MITSSSKPSKLQILKRDGKDMAKTLFLLGANSLLLAPTGQIFCDDSMTNWLNSNKVSINSANLSGKTIMQNFIGIIAWIARLVGLFVVAKSVLDWLQAKQDENAVNESKAIRQAAIGIAMVLAPTILQFMFQ